MLDLKKLIDKVLTFIKPKTGTITALNNFTLYEVNVMERWGVVSISGYATRSSAIGTSEVGIGTVRGVTFPTHHIRKHTGTGTHAYSPTNNGYVILTESGGLLCKSASTSDRTIVFDFCYVVGGVLRNPVISTLSRIGGVLNALNQRLNSKDAGSVSRDTGCGLGHRKWRRRQRLPLQEIRLGQIRGRTRVEHRGLHDKHGRSVTYKGRRYGKCLLTGSYDIRHSECNISGELVKQSLLHRANKSLTIQNSEGYRKHGVVKQYDGLLAHSRSILEVATPERGCAAC